MPILTKAMIQAGRSDRGGFNRAQVRALGMEYPLPKGWVRRLAGTEISDAAYADFLAAKNAHLDADAQPKPNKRALAEIVATLEARIERLEHSLSEISGFRP